MRIRRAIIGWWSAAGFWFTALLCAALPAPSQAADGLRPVTAAVPRHFPPQYQLDDAGHPGGFAVEVMNEVARRAGLHVTYRVEPDWPATMAALRERRADLIPNLGITNRRLGEFEFTSPLETFVVSVFVRRGSEGIRSAADLPGHRVAVVEENVAVDLLEDRRGITLVRYRSFEGAMFALLSGNADALAAPAPIVLKLARSARVGHEVEAVGEPLIEVRRAMAVRSDERLLVERLNPAIESFLQSPEYRRIYSRWYGSPEPYWTAGRVLWWVGGVSGVALALAVLGMAGWRYRTVVSLNHKLTAQLEELRRFQQVTVARELRMKELKDEVERLRAGRTTRGSHPDNGA